MLWGRCYCSMFVSLYCILTPLLHLLITTIPNPYPNLNVILTLQPGLKTSHNHLKLWGQVKMSSQWWLLTKMCPHNYRETCTHTHRLRWCEGGGRDWEVLEMRKMQRILTPPPPPFFFFTQHPWLWHVSQSVFITWTAVLSLSLPTHTHSYKTLGRSTFTRKNWRPCLSWNTHG